MAELQINEATLSDIIRARESLTMGSLDAKRPRAWEHYGYPEAITFAQMLQAYDRGGPAHGAVHRILDKCWQDKPRIKQPDADEETDWEKAVCKLLKSVKGWGKLRDFDRRNMVGRFAGLIYRVADGKRLSEPLDRARKLVDLIPVYEDQLKVTQWHSDQTDADNFGKPKMFQYRMRDLLQQGDLQGKPDKWEDVHPSRVQILAEGSVGDMFDGVPLLRAGFNALVDLEKISGGSAESYLKNSARTLVFTYEPNAALQSFPGPDGTTKSVRDQHEEQTRALNRNQDSSIVIQGGKADTLQTHQSDPTQAFDVAAKIFAASVRIPFTILFGQQTGRLASDEDKADMMARCSARRDAELTPMLEEFVTRMQACGVISEGDFEIEWPPLDAPGDEQKFDLLGKLTTAMRDAFQAGLAEPLFDANELRKVTGFEKRKDDGMPPEGADPMADDPPAPGPAPGPAPAPGPMPAPAPRPRLAAQR